MTYLSATEARDLLLAAPLNDVSLMVSTLLRGLLVPSIQFAGLGALVFIAGWIAVRGLSSVSG